MGYRTILLGTFTLTVVFDLTVAVEVGLILACVFFIYTMSTLFRLERDAVSPPGVRVHRLYGSLFFGAVAKVEAVGEALPPGTRAVVLEMHRLVLMDSTGLDAVQQLHRTLKRQGVRLLLCDLNEQPLLLIRHAEFDALLGQGNLLPDLATALGQLAGDVGPTTFIAPAG
jgi:SulP family sulfate permease